MVVYKPIAFIPRKLEAGCDVREPTHLFMKKIPFLLFSWVIKWRFFCLFQQSLPTHCPLTKAAGRSKARRREKLKSFKNQEQSRLQMQTAVSTEHNQAVFSTVFRYSEDSVPLWNTWKSTNEHCYMFDLAVNSAPVATTTDMWN